MTFDLRGYLTSEGRHTEVALELSLAEATGVPRWADPILRHSVLSGGKRIRPILCVAAWSAVRDGEDAHAGNVDAEVRALSCSLEFIHAYSLMHDDLPCMDDAPLRRGRPTPHTVFGERQTLRAGALLIPMAARLAWSSSIGLGLEPPVAGRVVETLMDGAGARGMVGGQWVDLASEGLHIDEAELTSLHGMKTGALLTAALRMGGLAGRADPDRLAALETYGRAIGLAFQIADDVLDRTASTEALGKEPSDVDMDKSTYVSLLGIDGALQRGRQEVARAHDALSDGGIESAALGALATYILERGH